MLQARPLFDNAADTRFFVEPEIWQKLIRAMQRRLNVMVTGSRGSGKTTLLHQLQAALRTDGQRVVFVDATAADSAAEFVRRLRDALRGRPSQLEERLAVPGENVGSDQVAIAGASRALHADLRAIGAVDRAIVLVDASDAGAAVYEVFGRLRDTLWQFEHLWVVAIDREDRATALKPPADAFFDVVMELAPLSTDELARVLRLRSPETPARILRHVAANAEGNPRRALRALGDAAVHGTDPASALAAHSALETAASLIGRPHGMLMAELLERGQASASDSDLQKSLGISRARLSQLFGDLLERELVVQEIEGASGLGRPRTAYRPVL
ncbi:MAG: AAA family ATPase [Actinomycetota bacterium]|nr:AAA family ATPase [Actinomycetota bacterium]